MTRLLLLGALLAGCASAPPATDAGPLYGTWSGTMARDGALETGRVGLVVDRGGVEVLSDGDRGQAAGVQADRVSVEGDRLSFRAPQFPVSPRTRVALRCDLALAEGQLGGTCEAGTSRYVVSLRPAPAS